MSGNNKKNNNDDNVIPIGQQPQTDGERFEDYVDEITIGDDDD